MTCTLAPPSRPARSRQRGGVVRRVLIAMALALAIAGAAGYAAWWPTSNWFGPVVSRVPRAPAAKSGPRIALTFDDGPDPDVTPRILLALAARGAHATFFLCGERVASHPELVASILRGGHELGNHSWMHTALLTLSRAAIREDLEATSDAIEAACGVRPHYFRPPYGLRDPRVLSVGNELHLVPVLWSVSPRDWQEPGAETIVRRALDDAFDGAIVLLHDGDAVARRGRAQTAEALPLILDGLAARGLRAVTLTELIATGATDAATR